MEKYLSRYTAARCFICHHFNLIHCIIFRYQIDSNELQKTYQLNLKVMVCYEAGESCGLNVVIHNNYVMNRTSCNLTDGFLNPCKYICVISPFKYMFLQSISEYIFLNQCQNIFLNLCQDIFFLIYVRTYF